jgi:membrane protease YdiL (CAAX protease family)
LNPDPVAERARASTIRWIGLFVALFGMLIVRQAVKYHWPEPTIVSTIVREAGMWLVGLLLVALIKLGERLPLSSVGLTMAHLFRSILWGLLLTVICFLAAGLYVAATHFTGGKIAADLAKLPVWLIIMTVVRAGVVEELCYRGYAIERLHALGLARGTAAGISLVIFGVAHWTGGWGNIGMALLLGAILTLFYLWRRNLVANMIGHTLVDFIPNVTPKLLR